MTCIIKIYFKSDNQYSYNKITNNNLLITNNWQPKTYI